MNCGFVRMFYFQNKVKKAFSIFPLWIDWPNKRLISIVGHVIWAPLSNDPLILSNCRMIIWWILFFIFQQIWDTEYAFFSSLNCGLSCVLLPHSIEKKRLRRRVRILVACFMHNLAAADLASYVWVRYYKIPPLSLFFSMHHPLLSKKWAYLSATFLTNMIKYFPTITHRL